MAEQRQCEFFLLRYVPDAVQDEFVNIGVMLLEPEGGFAEVRFTRDWRRVRCLDPDVDVDMLLALETEMRGRLADVADRVRLRAKLEDCLSNTIQLSAGKGCLTMDPALEMTELARLYLETRPQGSAPRVASGRQRIVAAMREAFETSGVWALMRKEIAAAPFTHRGDPLKIDCGYRPNGELKLFHGVSLQNVSLTANVDAVKGLAFSYPRMVEGLWRDEQAKVSLTAVVDVEVEVDAAAGGGLAKEATNFAIAILEQSAIRVVPVSQMAQIAAAARREMAL